MPMTAIDPLAQFLASSAGDAKPIPLAATRIDVAIRGGLAAVTTARTFRNTEQQSIEAAMTFPVPIDATLCTLSAVIDGRTVKGVAQARGDARETYEAAIGKGKAAVLHEELLRGIHMLSVGHIRPGAEVVVTDTWTAPLSFMDATPRLRIPTTVGEIYGRSPLSAGDDLATGGAVHQATIAVDCESGTATVLRAAYASAGRYHITLDAPIDVVVSGWSASLLEGIAADGRRVTLDIQPAAKADASLDVDVLFDHSGSMAERAAGDPEISFSKFDVAKAGLEAVTQDRLKPTDRIRLWEFNDRVRFIGEAMGAANEIMVRQIQGPDGGTEVGAALQAAIRSGIARNVVIVTDGKSWALDAQALARSGLRMTAVLIGEDALEAGIAHLAGMTGGQVFIATACDSGAAIAAALDAARAPFAPSEPINGNPVRVETCRRGARVMATWGAKAKGKVSLADRQIGATAAALAMPLMNEKPAAKLAAEEGIVTHLTSLVLIDETGERCAGLPARRKILLASPASPRGVASVACVADIGALRSLGPAREMGHTPKHLLSAPDSSVLKDVLAPINLGPLVNRIDWDGNPEALRRGDLSDLPLDAVLAIRAAAKVTEIVEFAAALSIDPVIVVVALLARAAGASNRSAQRLARAILGSTQETTVGTVMREMGL
jgi:hypothetical protein